MLDQALGFQPVVRRKNQDNTSETSSNKAQLYKQQSNRPATKPARPNLNTRLSEQKVQDNSTNLAEQPENSKQKSNAKLQANKSIEELPSPALADKHLKRLSKPRADMSGSMKSSARLYTHQSARVIEKQGVKPKEQDSSMYKIKMVLFLLISFFLMYQAMTPSRKCAYKKNK